MCAILVKRALVRLTLLFSLSLHCPNIAMPSSIKIKITPSMLMDAMYIWLKKYAKNEVSLFLVEQKIELELATVGMVYREDLWGNILECMVVLPTGWQEVQAAWQAVKVSCMWSPFSSKVYFIAPSQVPPLVEDVRAWQFIQVWVSGVLNLQAINTMEVVFRSCFVHVEWMAILSPMIEVWQSDEGGSKTHTFFKKLLTDHNLSLPPLPSQECRFLVHNLLPLGQDDNHFGWGSGSSKKQKQWKAKSSGGNLDTRLLHLDLGVIDLTGLKDTDETAKAGPSKVLQKRKRDADDDNDGDNVEVRSLKAPQKQRMVTCQRGSTKAGPSKVPQKRWKTHNPQSFSHFLNVSALDDEDEEDKEDCSGDDVAMVRHSQLPPCG